MIDKFCDFITAKIKNNMEDLDEERELVIDFGVRLIFGELPKILLLFMIGFLLGIGWYTLFFFFLLAPYRSFTGGFHLKTHLGCIITTNLLYLGPIALAKITPTIPQIAYYTMVGLLAIFSVVLIDKYAPADTENVPILSKKQRKKDKIKAYIALTILLLLALAVPNHTIQYMLLYGIFFQNLTVTPLAYAITHCKHSYEVYGQQTT